MKPTVRDIAERAGVSTASVSLVLNDKPSRITDGTKTKIIEAAKELGYEFQEKRQRKKENEAGRLIGVIRPQYHSEFVDMCLHGINRYAYVYGYKIISCDIDSTVELALEYLEVFKEIGVAGVIMLPSVNMNENGSNDAVGKSLYGLKKPFLLLDQAIDRVYCDFVTADNKGGAYMATEYLIHKGHQNIGVISGNREAYTSRKRIEGYKEALAFYDISIKDENVIYGKFERQTGYDGMKVLMERGVRAVFACDDEIAVGIYQYAQEYKLRIGDDISVVGFNHSKFTTMLFPALTAVSQPGELMGKKACEMLIERMEGDNKESFRTTYFSPGLIEKNSVKSINV